MPSVPRTIFVVNEDKGALRGQVQLIRSFGWSARAFTSPGACMYALLKEPPDCVVCKLKMPEMDARQLMAALDAKGIDVPIVVLTEDDAELSLVERAKSAGAAAVLRHPYWDEELLRSIRSVARRPCGPQTW